MATTEPRSASHQAEPLPLQLRVTRIMDGGDLPALSRRIIDALTALDDDAHALQRLANVVLREYSLTLAVVRTANSVHYRRASRPVQSATHAMMMLGARTVRQLAGSLLLFEHYAHRSPELRELMLLSLLTANHARAAAIRLQLPDPEEAHLCGMFRNLGEVLVAGHFPDDYAAIRALREGGASEVAAVKQVLGFPYVELGTAIARHWGMPDSVVQGMRARPTAAASLAASVTAFGDDLTRALYRLDAAPADAGLAVTDVLAQYTGRVRLTREQVGDVVADALEETRELFTNPVITTNRLRFRQLAASANAAFGGDLLTTGQEGDDGCEGSVAPTADLTLRTRLRQELESVVDPAAGATIGAVLLQALEAIVRGGPFDRALACFYSADRQQLVARTGLGADADALVARFDFPVSVRGGPVVALTQARQAVYLPVDRALTLAESRWAQSFRLGQFGVFPLVVLGKVLGCVYCDRTGDAAVPDRATVRFVRSVTELLVDAIASRRQG